MTAFISNPAAERFYGQKNDRMPSFAEHPAGSLQNELGTESIELLADWLRRDWDRDAASDPAGTPAGAPAAATPGNP